MVKVSVVEKGKAPYIEDDDDDFVTDDEDINDPDDIELDADDTELALTPFHPEDETLAERIAALKDILSPSTRKRLSSYYNATSYYVFKSGKIAGRVAWIGFTSALLVGLPLALSIENEGMLVQQEKEYYQQQQGQQAMVGAPAAGGQPTAPSGLVPPGF